MSCRLGAIRRGNPLGRAILDRDAGRLAKVGYTVNEVLKQGQPAEEIIKMADRQKVDLIVVGAKGLGAIARFLVGSVSTKVTTTQQLFGPYSAVIDPSCRSAILTTCFAFMLSRVRLALVSTPERIAYALRNRDPRTEESDGGIGCSGIPNDLPSVGPACYRDY